MANIARFCSTILLVSTLLSVDAAAHIIITRTSDSQQVSMAELSAAAASSDLILMGESHDDKYHHELQLDLIRSLLAGKQPLTIGLEMMQSDYQAQLDEWTSGRISEGVMQAVFERNWSDWPMYRDIFIYARDNKIPMVALNVPKHIVKKVSMHGFSSLTPEEKGNLPSGTSCDLKNPQVAFLKKAFQAVANHGQSGKMFSNFCEAQTVRNSGMALNMARYAAKQPGRKILVLTGIWHAVKYGIPDQLQRLGSKLSYTVILPETPYLNNTNSGASEADYLVEL